VSDLNKTQPPLINNFNVYSVNQGLVIKSLSPKHEAPKLSFTIGESENNQQVILLNNYFDGFNISYDFECEKSSGGDCSQAIVERTKTVP